MPAKSKGPRLWLRKARRDRAGRITHPAVYVIRDGEYQESTGCGHETVSALKESSSSTSTASTPRRRRKAPVIPIKSRLPMS
jgi:hypothetical protein